MRSSLLFIGLVLLPLGLACSGLPVGDPPPPTPDNPQGATDAPEPEPVDVAEPEPEPANPDTMFPAMNADEPPPFKQSTAVKCSGGATLVRHPAKRLKIFCVAGSGQRVGPYTEWQGSALREAGTNVEGKLEGAYTKWAGSGSKLRKVEEQIYVAGVAEGDFASWDEAGHLLVRGRMHEGKRQGRFIENKVQGGEVIFGGACYEGGAEKWRTADLAEFASKECAGAAAEES